MHPRIRAYRLFTWLALLSLLATTLPPLTSPPAYAEETPTTPDSGLYRTRVVVDSPSRRARLESLGIVVLNEDAGSTMVLADDDQLETMARLRFQPRTSDELGSLLQTQDMAQAWLKGSLQRLLQQGMALQNLIATNAEAATIDTARHEVRGTLAAMSVEQRAGLATLVSPDEDLDGLTNTEEAWWCTDFQNPNSDGDAQGYTDGQEVDALLNFTLPRNIRWGYGPPFGPPNAWPNFNDRLGTHVDVCNDGDWDTIPDYAETRIVGSHVPAETTDNDKFDDGQELFGVTYCPGAPTNCGYGSFPAIEYWNYIKANMPNWVRPPGDNIFVAAFPVPEVSVVPGSWTVDRVTTITTTQGQMTQTTNNYETSVMQGQSTSIADTRTWNNWEEVSESVETPIGTASTNSPIWVQAVLFGAARVLGGAARACLSNVICQGVVGNAVYDVLKSPFNGDENKDTFQLQNTIQNVVVNNVSSSAEAYASVVLNQNFDFQGVVNSLDSVQYAINQQGELLARGLYDINYAISRPRYTETHTNGHSWGGAQTTTHEVYEEHTITQGQAFTTGENWSTAWAVDSSHSADLTFTYEIKNTGTEYARELTGVIFNVYLGDDKTPIISYPAWQQFPNGKLENLFPADPPHQFASNPVPLTLDQMKRIDLGEPLRVVLEDFSYGADELFYQDAVNGGMTVFIEDGVDDGDELVDSYVIPTWGVENVQDVLTRYFPAGYDLDGNLSSLWTPEFNGISPPTWHEHFLSDIAWWNIYLTQADAGNTPLKDLPAEAGGAILFRFNRDSDRDGYQDRVELRYGTDKDDPTDHPQPEILAGYVKEQTGDLVTVKLLLENSGTFDAYGIDAVMYSPDDTTTIGNNTVGGNGKVRPGQHVAVGSLVKPPGLGQWGSSTAKPYSGSNYSGSTDRTYTFSAATPGVVGTGSTALNWNDGAGNTGSLPVGASYHSPLPVSISDGLEVGLTTGTIAAGASFTVTALTPRDTFTYTVDGPNYTEPVIVVSYSDPQGSHRFITPVELPSLDSDLAPYAGQMLKPIELGIATTGAVAAGSDNTTNLVVNSPHTTTIQDGYLYVDFVADGALVAHQEHTLDIPPGPTVFPVVWSTSTFTQTYNPAADNILLAHWTDSEGNIIDSAARPLNSFATDPKPALAMAASDETWDFDTTAQGTVLRRNFTLANTGQLDLLTYVSAPAGLSVSQTGSRSIAPGDMTTYDIVLNTATLPEGPYDDTITIRTSDPANPTRTVQVTGAITAAPADTPVGAMQRPLDWPATVSGTQGQWVEFTHTLGPEPETLHPVKVYSQDYGTLKGVGKYATPFGAGTAPYDMFGDGRDGVMPSNGNLDNNNGVGVAVVNNGSANAYFVNVTDAYAGWRINPGDVVLIHQTQGTGAGCWELNTAVSDYVGGTANIELAKPLQCSYASGGNDHAQIQRVPQYTDCPVSGTVTPLSGWNGSWGGILAVLCNGTMNVTGNLNVSGFGFRKGTGVTGQGGIGGEGINGRSGTGGRPGVAGTVPGGGGRSGQADVTGRQPGGSGTNTGGAGGGSSYDADGDSGGGGGGGGGHLYGGGGGGGGRGSAGPPYSGGVGGSSITETGGGGGGGGGLNDNSNLNGGASGQVGGGDPGDTEGGAGGSSCPYTGGGGAGTSHGSIGNKGGGGGGGGGGCAGQSDLVVAILGAGGGAGGGRDNPGRLIAGTDGGNGGGIIILTARTITVDGSVVSNGDAGSHSTDGDAQGSGGGGAGGSILVRTQSATLGTTRITAIGGPGGTRVAGQQGLGGHGSPGRIRIEYCDTISGSASPPASTQQLNCYIAEQIESTPYTTTRLNLPESGSHTYQVQYGRKLNWSSAISQTMSLRVPAGLFTSATLQALVSDLSANAWFAIDVGNTGSDSWNSAVANASQYTSPDLAAFFNAYWADHGAPTTGYLDVPIRVYLDRAGQVLLTNLQVTLTGSKLRAIRLPVQPQGYGNVTTSFTISDGTGPLAVGVDVGDNGSVDWTYTGSPTYPVNLVTGNLAAAVNAYLTGHSGEVDVPLRFTLAPFATLNLTSMSATPVGQPDAQIGAGDLVFSAATPVETDPITVTATLHNPGTLDSGGLTAMFSAELPGWGAASIGATYVPNIPANGTVTASILWDTTGFTGTIPVRVVIDPYNRVAETNENNNEATAGLTILTRPDLHTTQVALSNPEPVIGETITITLSIDNAGQTAAGTQTVALYDGSPESSGALIEAQSLALLAGGASTNMVFTWMPVTTGDHHLFARLDQDNQVNESDETNNDTQRDVYLGLAGPLRLDSGGANDPPYAATLGYGYLNGDASTFCGTRPDQSQRTAPEGEVRYRFDHLLPGHYYHLDITLFECDGAGRVEALRVDDNQIGGTIDLTDGVVHRISTLLDPAFYTDNSITVGISETIGYDAVVARVNLHDVDYRYSDAGRSNNPADPNDPAYPYASPGRPARLYGYVDGVDNRPWGTLPYQSRRIDLADSNPLDDPDNELRYQFDGLDTGKRYRLNLTFFQNAGGASIQTVYADDFDTDVTVTLNGQQRVDRTAEIPASAYAGDGSTVVRIVRTNALANAFVNVLALEEITSLCDAPDLSCDGQVTVADIIMAAQGWTAGEMTIVDVQRIAASFQP